MSAESIEQSESPASPPESQTPESQAAEAQASEAGAEAQAQVLLHGVPVAPGLAVGPAHIRSMDLDQVRAKRVPLEDVEKELNRFQRGLARSRQELLELKERLTGHVPEEQMRILDTHMTLLKDSVFLSDVENLILSDRMSLEGAVAKVILDFDRIFKLVESETLRERAVDLRDVGIRVLRSLEEAPEREATEPEGGYVLATRELSIVDMFAAGAGELRGVLSESGSLTSHAAILARSLRIPTLTGIDDLLEQVEEGDWVILDATEGVVRLRPDEIVREQFSEAHALRQEPGEGEHLLPAETADGRAIDVSVTCGNLPEVERAVELGATSVGLYRTELLYLVDRAAPTLEALTAHYRAVLEQARGEVTFRLLDVDSGLELSYLHDEVETNPELGLNGVRLLLAQEDVLRTQLTALLTAAGPDHTLNIAVPKVIDDTEVARVRVILEEERHALSQTSTPPPSTVRVGVVIETPASLYAVRDLANVAEFFVVGLDSFQQYLLAADRENRELAQHFERLHPAAVRALTRLVEECDAAERSVTVFGITAARLENVPLLLGCGFRRIAVAPVAVESTVGELGSLEMSGVQRLHDVATKGRGEG